MKRLTPEEGDPPTQQESAPEKALIRIDLVPKHYKLGRWVRFKKWLSRGVRRVYDGDPVVDIHDLVDVGMDAGKARLEQERLKAEKLRAEVESEHAERLRKNAETARLLAEADLLAAQRRKTDLENDLLLDQRMRKRGLELLAALKKRGVRVQEVVKDGEVVGVYVRVSPSAEVDAPPSGSYLEDDLDLKENDDMSDPAVAALVEQSRLSRIEEEYKTDVADAAAAGHVNDLGLEELRNSENGEERDPEAAGKGFAERNENRREGASEATTQNQRVPMRPAGGGGAGGSAAGRTRRRSEQGNK